MTTIYSAKKDKNDKCLFLITKIIYDDDLKIIEKEEWNFLAHQDKNTEQDIINNILIQEEFREKGII